MPSGKYTKTRLRRRRQNPLRRRADIAEAWVVLAVWVTIAVGGTIAGLVTAHAASEAFTRQRAERQPVRAVVLNDVPRTATALGGTTGRRMAPVRWTTPDGSTRTGRTLVATGLKAGSTVAVWQDGKGLLVPEPMGPTVAVVESGLLGVAAGIALAGLVSGAGAVARWRLDLRRIDQWGQEWDLVGPTWGHRTS
ncbi:hypothetical protein PV726_42390 [Streptomyces europaeiscabiei]|uniref:Rv1733c family protein n=1 Tax=Streptomyces europaeiscabiei TaxID=146819 RepID=UPI0029BBB35C|nr:hypothetical protein [Streptomyces europaeiscabiei]MDX3696782.1 hypothetical protein [Streptomyces europaeiscabiei]